MLALGLYLWFKGTCDRILATVQKLYQDYDKAEVFATRDWRDQVGGHRPIPRRYYLKIAPVIYGEKR